VGGKVTAPRWALANRKKKNLAALSAKPPDRLDGTGRRDGARNHGRRGRRQRSCPSSSKKRGKKKAVTPNANPCAGKKGRERGKG